MSQLDRAFNAFKLDPTAANAWALQVAMVEHQKEVAKQEEGDCVAAPEEELQEKPKDADSCKRLKDIGDYEVYRTEYSDKGRKAYEYSAYRKGTKYSEAYRIARSSLKKLREEIGKN